MISGHGNIESAVKAIKTGAFDFVEKPLSLEKTVLVVRNALRQRHLEAENRALRARVDRDGRMVGESHIMRQLREQVAMAAPTNGRVLIFGENGTGKELVARTVHALSRRRNQPFVEVNCAAIPEELIESELFGHVKGAFTGAVADRKGRFEAAHSGTIFLDEIGDMSIKTQAKVLRVLQEQVTEPVGSTSRVQVDVRVLAATNKDLLAEIRAGPIPRGPVLPAERHSHLRAAAARARRRHPAARRAFHRRFRARVRKAREDRDAAAMARLKMYRWPGNVRELRNVIERVVIMAPEDDITDRDLAFLSGDSLGEKLAEDPTVPAVPLYTARDQFERDYILRELAHQQGNISRTAEVLGVERSNLYKKMRAFGIVPRRTDAEGEDSVTNTE